MGAGAGALRWGAGVGGRDEWRMQRRLLSSGAPSPNPAAEWSFPWPRRAKPHPLDPPTPGLGWGRPRASGLERGFVRCAPDKPPARRGTGGGRPQRPPSPIHLPPPRVAAAAAAAAAGAQALSGCWAGAEAGTRQRGVGEEPQPFLVRGLPLFPLHCPGRGRQPGWGRAL